MLSGKKILIGVTGSIAAYKAASLVRLFVQSDAEVKVVMTPSASDFISALTLSTLSKNPVLSQFTSGQEGEWNNHVELGLWADVFLIAPLTASTLAKMATGQSDNLLVATYLSARCPVFVAPAMDLDMYQHPTTKTNFDTLKTQGVQIIDSTYGELASGLVGTGRMAEPEALFEAIFQFLSGDQPLSGKKALVTAGPTHEKIDPVRFIGNYSSGKMGVAIARELQRQGAEVVLVLGPVTESFDLSDLEVRHVVSADEMHQQALEAFPDVDIAVLSAAVADYKPKDASDQKLKKKDDELDIKLAPTPDIALSLGEMKENQVVVGFALETNNALQNALEKKEKKNFDLIVLNSLEDKGAGFGHDTNKVTIIGTDNNSSEFELKSKKEVAHDIVQAIIDAM